MDSSKFSINLLNFFGKQYNVLDGFSDDHEMFYVEDDDFIMDILNQEHVPNHYDIAEADSVIFKKWFLVSKSKITVPFKEVILKIPSNYWIEGKPHMIGKPGKIYEWYNNYHYQNDNLSSRKYIHVDIMYEKITISSTDKGSPLCIEDILFATKGLCLDGHRFVVDNWGDTGYQLKQVLGIVCWFLNRR